MNGLGPRQIGPCPFGGSNIGRNNVALNVATSIVRFQASMYDKQPCRTSSLSGHNRVHEIWNAGHARCIQEVFQMSPTTLNLLQHWLCNETSLGPSRYISLLEKLAIFMFIAGQGASNCLTQEEYQYSSDTISHCFHEVLTALIHLGQHYISVPQAPFMVHPKISSSRKFSPYFNDCIGALDGTHVQCHMPVGDTAPYRNRKDYLSQNVLAVCRHDMLFHYVLPGWEGSAHDTKVLGDAIENKRFQIPKGKCYLADAGYSNSNFMMILYSGIRYHLKEQTQAAMRPANEKKLFNLRHAQLRNIIERIFSVFKRRFQIFGKAPEYPFKTQVKLIYALAGLHNFIRQHPHVDPDDEEAEDIYEEGDPSPVSHASNPTPASIKASTLTSDRMNKRRDDIAAAMWIDYQEYLSENQRS